MDGGRSNALGVALPSGELMVTGGLDGSRSRKVVASAATFDPVQNRWVAIAGMPEPRCYALGGALDNGKALCAGGRWGPTGQSKVLATVVIYDPNTNTWSDGAPMHEARSQGAGASLGNGKFLATGGEGHSYKRLSSCEVYDPAADTWTKVRPMSKARQAHTAGMLRAGKVLVAGGRQDTSCEVYDAASNTWSAIANMRSFHSNGAGGVLPSGRFVIAGGATSLVEVYDPSSNVWTALESLSTPRRSAAGAVLTSGAFVLAGGWNVAWASAEVHTTIDRTFEMHLCAMSPNCQFTQLWVARAHALTHAHTRSHANTHALDGAQNKSMFDMHMHACNDMNMNLYTHTCTHARRHTQAHTYTHAHTHRQQTHAHVRTCTHSRTHANARPCKSSRRTHAVHDMRHRFSMGMTLRRIASRHLQG